MTRPVLASRNAVRAVVMRDDALLVQRKEYEHGWFKYTLPGGAPDPGETLEAGLQRECQEEIGTTVEIIELMHVADFFKPRDTDPPSRRQQIEFLFRCRVPDDYVARNGSKPDPHQVDVVWLSLGDRTATHLYPGRLRHILTRESYRSRVYLGLID